jgi:hypothetical protein
LKIFSLTRTLNNLQNITEWAEQEKKLESLNEEEIDTLRNALNFLKGLQELVNE